MSGVKRCRLADGAAAQEALRRAAEERARQEINAARVELEGACSALSAEIDARRRRHAGDVFTSLVGALEEAQRALTASAGRATASTASAAPITPMSPADLRERALAVRTAVDLAARSAAIEASLPKAHAASKRAMLDDLARAGDLDELRAALSRWSSREAMFPGLESCLHGAERASAFLRACDVADVPLDADVASARRDVEAFLRSPDPARASEISAKLPRLRSRYLEMQLEARRAQLFTALDRLTLSEWPARLEAWRGGFSRELDAARLKVREGDWTPAAPVLRELTDFLSARAKSRVEVLLRGGEAAGFRADPPAFDGASRAWVSELHDEHGLLGRISEACVDWRALAEDDLIEVLGPEEWDGPACVHGGYDLVLRALREQGVEVHLYGEDGVELSPPQESSAPAEEGEEELEEIVVAAPGREGARVA